MKYLDVDKMAAEIKARGPMSALEEAIMDQLLSFAKTLPPIPDDQFYQLICSDPVYNPATDIYEFTIKAETRQATHL